MKSRQCLIGKEDFNFTVLQPVGGSSKSLVVPALSLTNIQQQLLLKKLQNANTHIGT